jgi:serine/threonine protein phosphatase 1
MGRTFVIGDVHGEREHLERLLGKLPFIAPDDTLVLLGDYLDRGPDSRGVIELLRRLPEQTAGKVVFLRGNHEDIYVRALAGDVEPGFFLIRGNGAAEALWSFRDKPVERGAELSQEDAIDLLDPRRWIPPAVATWLTSLLHWYEDDHAIYVHAGLDGEGAVWKHPRDGATQPLLWMREEDFYLQYEGKTIVFGHTPTPDLPPRDPDRVQVWRRGPLWGIDTGCGRGGPLSAIELPSGTIYDSR